MKKFSLLLVLLLAGCGGDGMTQVSGTLSWQGSPIEKGTIEFAPVDGKTASAAGIVENGRYTLDVPHGEKIVRIYGIQEGSARTVKDEMGNVSTIMDTQQYLPPEVNEQSNISLTVQGKRMTFDWAK